MTELIAEIVKYGWPPWSSPPLFMFFCVANLIFATRANDANPPGGKLKPLSLSTYPPQYVVLSALRS